MSNEIVSYSESVVALSTTNKKGERVSFEASIAFAPKTERERLTVQTYSMAVQHGRYAGLIRDALQSGIVSKDAASIITDMLGTSRNPPKEVTTSVCNIILGRVAGKELKGKKAFYAALIRKLHDVVSNTHVPASSETVEA